MDKTKTKDITFRIFAILISVFLWMYVSSKNNPVIETTISNIPVELINTGSLAQNDLILIKSPEGYKTNLTIKGRQNDVLAVKASDFKLVADVGSSNRFKGNNSILVDIRDWPENVDIPKQPVYINNVELDELVTKNFPLTVNAESVKVKDGYYKENPQYKLTEVILRGASRYIGSVNSVVANMPSRDNIDKDISVSLPIQVLDKSGNDITSNLEQINPNTVDVSINILRQREIPINIKLTGDLPSGVFMNGNATATPGKVTVIGDDRIVNNIKAVDTEPVNLGDVTSSTTRNVKFILPQGVRTADNSTSVNVSINVETTINKTFSIPVNIVNLPGELNADLLTNTITVTLSGRESQINQLVASDITAVIDMANAAEGETEYTPKITSPDGFVVREVSPPKIRAKISKKQG